MNPVLPLVIGVSFMILVISVFIFLSRDDTYYKKTVEQYALIQKQNDMITTKQVQVEQMVTKQKTDVDTLLQAFKNMYDSQLQMSQDLKSASKPININIPPIKIQLLYPKPKTLLPPPAQVEIRKDLKTTPYNYAPGVKGKAKEAADHGKEF